MQPHASAKLPLRLIFAGWLAIACVAQAQEPPRPGGAGQRAGGGRGAFGPGTMLGGQMFSQADKNADQKLTPEEFAALADAWFDRLDSERTGTLNQERFTARLGEILAQQPGAGALGNPRRGTGATGARDGRGGFSPAAIVAPGLFTTADMNKDGSLERAELKGTFTKWFAGWDSEQSGWINQEKLVAGLNAALPRPALGGRNRSTTNPSGAGPEAALKQTGKLTVPEGLEATLFASEPMVVNAADMDIDARGRIWVTEGANYRASQTNRLGGDRIVILEDTDRNGQADRQTVFYQDPSINCALGICVLGNKVIVSSSPYVFVLTDTNGDDVADTRQVLFADTSQGNHDHCVHAFVFGPDGKFYFNFGNQVRQLIRPKAGLLTVPLHGEIPAAEYETVKDLAGNEVKADGRPYRQGMVFRCNPDGSEVETLAWNFRNNYEVAVDSFGTLWQSDNDDDGNRGVRINCVMEFGNFGYADEMTGAAWRIPWSKAQDKGAPESERIFYEWHQYDPGVVPNLLHTGAGSPTGICVYEGKLLPTVFQNQVIHCDAGPRAVRAYPVENDGAGYKSRIENIITTEDAWFRPSDVCVAPDGSLYVADWNDAGVGGHQMADQKLETMTGRVYRIAPKGHQPAVPKLNLATAAGCVQALQSPNQATRYLAWTKLNELQSKAERELVKLWRAKDSRMRARALHLLARIKGKERKYVEQGLKDRDPNLRITSLRIARELKLDVIPFVAKLATDASPQVRRECAIALRHHPSAQAPKLWATLAQQHDGKDRWHLEALGIGADGQWEKFFEVWLTAVGDHWNTPAGRDVIWRSRSTKTPALLVKIITEKNTDAKERDRYLRSFDFIQGPEKDAALAELLTSAAAGGK